MFSKSKDSGFPYGCADAAATDGRRGSNVYEVKPWLWQFGRVKPHLGPGRPDHRRDLRKEGCCEQYTAQACSRDSTASQLEGSSSLIRSSWCCMIECTSRYEYIPVCTSMYEYVRMYRYNQGLQIFMACTYFFSPLFAQKYNVLCSGDVSVHL
jgi:hypothetical protein